MTDIEPEGELDERYLVQPVLKAMQVLQLICAAAEPVTLNQLVREAGLPKTTVFRYLKTLATIGFIAFPTRAFAENIHEPAARASDGRGHVARIGPAGPERQTGDHSLLPAHPFHYAYREFREQRIGTGMKREIAPHGEPDTLLPRSQVALRLLFTKLAQQVG